MATTQTATAARQVLPEFFIVNYAHAGLNQRAKEAQFRIVGAFSTRNGAQAFSDKFSKVHGMDCFCVMRGQPNMIPKDYWFVDDPKGAQTKLQGMIDASMQERQEERKEFQDNRTRKQKYAQKGADFDADLERAELQKLLQQRQTDEEKAQEYLQSEMFSLMDPVNDKMRGAFSFAAVSTIPDKTTDDAGAQEHAFIVHNAFKSVEEAKEYIAKELEIKVQDRELYVVDMYEWMQPSFSFSEFVMGHVPTKYRDKMQDQIMQFKMSGARLKKESLEARYQTELPALEITDGDPETVKEEAEEAEEAETIEEGGMQIADAEDSEEYMPVD